MIQFSNDKIRKQWQGKQFIPSEVKDIKPITSTYAKYTLVGDKRTGALMVKKEYTGKMKGKKPTELWLVVGKDKANHNKEGILSISEIFDELKNEHMNFDSVLEHNGYSLYCIKGYDKNVRSKATELVMKNDFFELYVSSWLCSPDIFTVFGKLANYEDFGVKEDIDSAHAADYCCGNMKFTAFDDDAKIEACCKKYKIDRSQFDEICKALDEGLSFGKCGLCC